MLDAGGNHCILTTKTDISNELCKYINLLAKYNKALTQGFFQRQG